MGRCGAVRNLTQRKAEYLEVTFRITKCIVWLNDMRVGGGGGNETTWYFYKNRNGCLGH